MNGVALALIVDDSELTRAVLRRYLTAEGLAVVEAADGVQGAVAALRDQPAVVVTDLDMPVMDGFQLARLLKNDPATSAIPLVILTSHREASARFWGYDSGADAYVTKDELDKNLVPTVRRLLAARPTPVPAAVPGTAVGPLEVLARVARQLDKGLLEATLVNQLLQVGIEKGSLAAAVRSVLAFLARIVDADLLGICVADEKGARLHLHRPGSSAAEIDVNHIARFLATLVGRDPADLGVVQVDGGLGGSAALAENEQTLRLDLPLRDARAILVVWPRPTDTLEGMPVELLGKAAPHVALVLDNVRLAEKLWELSTHDELTGLLNHRAILSRLGEETERTTRYHSPLSVALCDIDRFKRVNDTLGHPAGDRVLHEVASRLRASLRSTDVIGRYGGEEFLVILPNAEIEAARRAAERLCTALGSEPISPGAGQKPISVTASFGVACNLEVSGRSLAEGIISLADTRLYEAKAAGRCCVKP